MARGPLHGSILATSCLAVAFAGCADGSGRRGPAASTAPAAQPFPAGGVTAQPAPGGSSAGAVGSAGTGAASSATTGASPATPPAQVVATVTGPGPRRLAADAVEAAVLTLRLEPVAPAPGPVEVEAVRLRAGGRLDDAAAVRTVRLVHDRDGDGRWDRAVDRVLATGAFAQDDGEVELRPQGLDLAAGADLLVLVDLTGQAAPHEDLRLALEAPRGVALRDPAGSPRDALVARATGPRATVGAWVAPHEAVAVPAEGLRPRAVRDGQGRTHFALFQNANMQSNVFYALWDGRAFSPLDDVSRAGARTAWNHDVAVDAGDLPHLAWEERLPQGDTGIRYSRFDAAAFGWTAGETVSDDPTGQQLDPRLATTTTPAGQVVDAVWEGWGAQATPRVMHRRRAAAGWLDVADVCSATDPMVHATDPALASWPGGEALVVWAENEPGRSEVRARALAASGAWGPVQTLARGQGVVARPELLVDGATLHLAWVDDGEVHYARRTPQGWSAAVNVSRSPMAPSSEPTLAMWRGALHVAWIEATAQGAHVAHAVAQGGGFGPIELLTLEGGVASRLHPFLLADGDRLVCLWQDRRLGRQRVFWSWTDDGRLDAPRTVAAPGGDPGRPALAGDRVGGTHALWSIDAGGAAEVFWAHEPAPGAGFAQAENVSRSPHGSYAPTAALLPGAPGAVVTAWEEDAPGGFAVVLAERGPAGWSTPAAVSSAAPAYAPALAASARAAALVWTEARPAPGGGPGGGQGMGLRLRRHDGAAWSATEALAEPPAPAADAAWSPHAAWSADGARLAVAWEAEAGWRREVRVATLGAAEPASAAQVAAVASSAAGQWAPRAAWAGDDLWVAWVEDGRARVAVLPAGAATFEAPIDLTSGGAWQPDLIADGRGPGVLVAWEQWTGADARVLLAEVERAGARPAVALDHGRGPHRRVALTGDPVGGARAAGSAPGRGAQRAARAR